MRENRGISRHTDSWIMGNVLCSRFEVKHRRETAWNGCFRDRLLQVVHLYMRLHAIIWPMNYPLRSMNNIHWGVTLVFRDRPVPDGVPHDLLSKALMQERCSRSEKQTRPSALRNKHTVCSYVWPKSCGPQVTWTYVVTAGSLTRKTWTLVKTHPWRLFLNRS